MLTLTLKIQPVRAGTIIVPDDYPTIQVAINHANVGETVFVKSGVYPEEVVINKTVSLVGENASNTIIDGMSKGNVIDVYADNVVVSGFTVINSSQVANDGIYLYEVKNCCIRENRILGNWRGIRLYNCSKCIIYRNNILNTTESLAIWLEDSNGTIIDSNVISNNSCGVYLGWSDNDLVYRNTITDSDYYGLTLTASNMSSIIDNVIQNSSRWEGLALWSSSFNKIVANSILNSHNYGLLIGSSSNNTICHNNFIDNAIQVYDPYREYGARMPSVNSWDDGYPYGGNYWSDYNGTDFYHGRYQNVSGSDGIGDTPYVINVNNRDNYPFMKTWVRIPGDVNYDGRVNMIDIGIAARALGSYVGSPGWNPLADMNEDGKIDMLDILFIARNFGKTYS
jgi:parallel beta-helix repeat protein